MSSFVIFNNYSPQAQWILLNNPRDKVEGIIEGEGGEFWGKPESYIAWVR